MTWRKSVEGDSVRTQKGLSMRRIFTSLIASVVVGLFGFAGTAFAHSSPEYFWDGVTSATQIGHRHTLSQVSARVQGAGGGGVCVAGLNDDGSFAGGQIACAGGTPGELASENLNGSSWRRGYADPTGTTDFRAREDF
jgi:hypothetical protein